MKHFVGNILLSLVFLSALTQFIHAQEKIYGKVIDGKNGEIIPYCNISVEASLIGTVSNELGEFIIEVDSLPIKLVFSHISYGEKIFEISQNSDNVVELQPFTNNLDEVTVIANKKDFYALELAQKAYQKANRQSSQRKYGKGFYRQKSKNGDNYSEFSEIIYDIRYTTKGIEDWNILEGRYALKDEFVNNKNYTLLSRWLTPLQPETDELFFPLSKNMEAYYNIRVVDVIESDAGKIMVVWFKPTEQAPKTTFEGEVYINADTYDILKITGNLEEDDLKLVRLKEKNSSWKNYKIAYEISYKIDSTMGSIIDFIKVDHSFDYYKDDGLQYPVSSTSNLVFFEYYVPLSWKKLGGNFKKKKERLATFG
ncbi:carboxypeptidase-like regulatory domain-containing protein [Maribacter halichondriae]|uniref:carboxypeptidase-like regulatory domain-containing protein n=1 Tax=Maribacter halichondriae TaxID=2980554 RepID=UPI002359A040|nr:carboxypeptidase-like regulatory domain-containing protein [Maribacter sp. Hal144]